MIFFKQYSNAFPATLISLLSGVCGLGAIVLIIMYFTDGSHTDNLTAGIIMGVLWYPLRRLADKVALKIWESKGITPDPKVK